MLQQKNALNFRNLLFFPQKKKTRARAPCGKGLDRVGGGPGGRNVARVRSFGTAVPANASRVQQSNRRCFDRLGKARWELMRTHISVSFHVATD